MQDSDSFVARSHVLTGQYIAEVVKALFFSCQRRIYHMRTSSIGADGLIDKEKPRSHALPGQWVSRRSRLRSYLILR